MRTSIAFATIAPLVTVVQAQPVVQYELDTASGMLVRNTIVSAAGRTCLVWNDGGVIDEVPGLALSVLDDNLQPQWFNRYGNLQHAFDEPGVCALPDGRFAAVMCLGADSTAGLWHLRYVLMTIGADGGLDWAREFHVPVGSDQLLCTPSVSRIVSDGGDGIYVLAGFEYAHVLMRWTTEGMSSWSQWIGDSVNPWGVVEWSCGDYRMAGNTEHVVLAGLEYSNGPRTIASFSSAGVLEWAAEFEYLANVGDGGMSELFVAPDGKVVLTGQLTMPNNPFGYILRTEQNGALAPCHFYRISGMVGQGKIHFSDMRADGQIIAGTGINTCKVLMRIAPDGTATEAAYISGTSANDLTYVFNPVDVSWKGDQAQVINAVVSTHQLFGTITTRPGIWEVPLNGSSGCQLSPVQPESILLPDSLTQVTDLTGIYLSEPVDVFPQIVSVEVVGLVHPSLEEQCGQLVGMNDLEPKPAGVNVFPNPVEGGVQVSIQCENAHRFALFNTAGALIKDMPAGNGNVFFCSSELTSGLYSIVAFGKDDQRLATAKLQVL